MWLLRHRYIVIMACSMIGRFAFGVESLDSLLSSLNSPQAAKAVEPAVSEPQSPVTTVQEAVHPVTIPAAPKPVVPVATVPEEVNPLTKALPGAVVPAEPKPTELATAKVTEPKTVAVVPAKVTVEPKVIEPEVEAKGPQPFKPVAPIVPVMPISPMQATLEAAPKFAAQVTAPETVVAKTVQPQLQVVDIHEVSSQGLDTLNVDSSGNWLEKRIWYKKSEQLFDVIRTNLQKTADLRMQFVQEVNKVGQQIDEFKESVSFEKGQIDELLQLLLLDLANQTEVRGGDLSSSERSVKSKALAEQKQFDAMSKDLKLIDDLDEQVDKTMMKAFKEIDTCRGLETRAWNNFKDIGLELDDKKARVLYYEMENFHKNIEQKMNYLQSNLLPYLQNQLVGKVNETMTQIKSSVQALDAKGLNLKTLLEKDEHGDLLVLKAREKIVEEEAIKAAQDKELANREQAAKQEALKACPWYQRWICTVIAYIEPVWQKVAEWFVVVICCVQCVLCKIQELICRLLGY